MVRGRKSSPDTVTVTARSYETLALPYPLSFEPPLVELSGNPDGLRIVWQYVQYVFDLPDPARFVPMGLNEKLAKKDLDRVLRYIASSEELATSTLLNYSSSVTVSFDRETDTEEVHSDLVSKELTRAFAVLFRQIHSDDSGELASFKSIHQILSRQNDEGADRHHAERQAHLAAWNKARKRLKGTSLHLLVGKKLRQEGKLGQDLLPFEDDESPEFLISRYNYGELIHWNDKHREELAIWEADPFLGPWNRMRFLEAVAGLAHTYIGYSVLVRKALDAVP